MSNFIGYVIRGIPFGCVFSLMAIGLVLTYKTSGVFNLAFAAQAYLSAAVYYDTHIRHHWPIPVAAVFSIVVVGAVVGFVLDRALFRYLRTAPPIARLVTSLGLLVALPAIVQLWFGSSSPSFGVVGIWFRDYAIYRFGDYALSGDDIATILSLVVVGGGLTLMFRYSSVGLRMRAVVESPRMTELSGINADRVGTFSWILSSIFAALAGVLVAPLFSQVASPYFITVLIAAVAAAAFGRLTSIPLTILGGILLGIASGLLGGYLPPNSVLAQGLRPSLPFVVLFLLLLFWPGLRQRREAADPLAGVDPPPKGLAAAERSVGLTWSTRIFGVIVGGVLVFLALTQFSHYWLLIFTQAAIFGTIFLSITVITGMAGQISLCQATFAAIGAFGTAQMAKELDLPVLVAILLAAVLAAIVGALLAIPALRLGGIFLALATFAFALMFQNVVVPLKWVGGGLSPTKVARPTLGPFDFASDRSFFVLCVVILAIVSFLVIFVRRGTTGRYLDALRGSEVAAASIGINPARPKITAFALSAGIAGLGGGLLASQQGQATPSDYDFFIGLFWVVLVVSLGSRTVEGAINAAVGLMLFPELLKFLGLSPSYEFIFFGLGAITYARNPEGILEVNKRKSLAFVQRQIDRFRKQPPPATGAASAPGTAPLAKPSEPTAPVTP